MANYNIQSRIGKLLELEGRGVIKPEHKTELDAYRAQGQVKTPGPAPVGTKADTAPQDLTALNAASDKAMIERDAVRDYANVARAVQDYDTGPVQARWHDAIIPDEDGGVMDTIGATLGTPFRAMIPKKKLEARDHLKTVNAQVALVGSGEMKGSSSDKDTAIMRLAGVGPSKQPAENQRIIRKATIDSGLEQARALARSNWISKYGSAAARSENGMTMEQNLQYVDQSYARNFARRQAARKMPKAPPSRRGGGTLTIDLDGNPIR